MQRLFAKVVQRFFGRFGKSEAPGVNSKRYGGNRIWSLPTNEAGSWITQAQAISPFVCDAAFLLESSFYVGPENGLTQRQSETARVELPAIDLQCQFADLVTTAEALGREHALINYYRRIVEIAMAHGKTDLLKPFPYFRTKPVLIADGQVLTDFLWNDDMHETRTILQHFAESAHGPARLLHVDEDQGWHVQIAATGTATCLIEWEEGTCPPASGGYACASIEVAHQATAALERLDILHRRFVGALGSNYWD